MSERRLSPFLLRLPCGTPRRSARDFFRLSWTKDCSTAESRDSCGSLRSWRFAGRRARRKARESCAGNRRRHRAEWRDASPSTSAIGGTGRTFLPSRAFSKPATPDRSPPALRGCRDKRRTKPPAAFHDRTLRRERSSEKRRTPARDRQRRFQSDRACRSPFRSRHDKSSKRDFCGRSCAVRFP